MPFLLFVAFAAFCLVLIAQVIAKPERVYECPWFMAFAFTGFVMPQAYGLVTGKFAPDDWVAATMVMCILCLGACWIGYHKTNPGGVAMRRLNIEIDPRRLAISGFLFVLMGIWFDRLIDALPLTAKGTQWTGIVTIYGFFAGQIITGFAISLFCAMKYKFKGCWVLAGIAAVIPIRAAVMYGRRESTVLFLMTIMLELYFVKGIKVPRSVIISLLFASTVLIPVTEQYRASQDHDLGALYDDLDFTAPLKAYADPTAVSEVKNAMYVIAACRASSTYQFGAAYWNRLVFNFVPAQFVGKPFKDALMIGDPDLSDPSRLVGDFIGYRLPVGSTLTGIGDSFYQFGFLGCIFFAGMGCFFRYIWTAANFSENAIIQVFYIQVMVGAMHGLTHESMDFMPAVIYSGGFLFLVVLFARKRRQPHAETMTGLTELPSGNA
ncbi:MAG TPA: hypothetical protein VKB79_13640 [Bryobacteraceae bacterium]|nr:hypothetical protein [Bryobacteraceae bacterium]